MSRSHDAGFFECPICGKKPYVETFDMHAAWAYCKGYGFHRHKKVSVFVTCSSPSKILKNLSHQWNQMGYEEARFLFRLNGNPFKDIDANME